MISFCGYNFPMDINSLDCVPTNINSINSVQLQNGVFDHFNLTRDVTNPYSQVPPTTWTYLDVMDANFNGNISAGNIDFVASSITAIKVKRRKMGTFNWITLKIIPINDVADLTFSMTDNLASNDTEYEYAFVPVVNETEGNYITNSVLSKFDGVFICDSETIYKFYAGVSYGDGQRVQKVGVFEPYGRKYPVVVSNGVINYYRGSFSGTVLPADYLDNRNLDRLAMVQQREGLLDFLTKKKAKILKDLKLCS